jgi:hypothetical protein
MHVVISMDHESDMFMGFIQNLLLYKMMNMSRSSQMITR